MLKLKEEKVILNQRNSVYSGLSGKALLIKWYLRRDSRDSRVRDAWLLEEEHLNRGTSRCKVPEVETCFKCSCLRNSKQAGVDGGDRQGTDPVETETIIRNLDFTLSEKESQRRFWAEEGHDLNLRCQKIIPAVLHSGENKQQGKSSESWTTW